MTKTMIVGGGATILDCSFSSTYDNIAAHLDQLKAVMAEERIKPECTSDVLIVLGEVLNNIVEHGYKEACDGIIGVCARKGPDAVHVTTIDNGPPVPPVALTGSRLPTISEDLADLPEGGFGWFMIHALTNDMNYERIEGQNRLTFSISV